MNQQERIAICELCKKKSFSQKYGVICSLTKVRAEFEFSCNDFLEDAKMTSEKNRHLEVSNDRLDRDTVITYLLGLYDGVSWKTYVAVITWLLIVFVAVFLMKN